MKVYRPTQARADRQEEAERRCGKGRGRKTEDTFRGVGQRENFFYSLSWGKFVFLMEPENFLAFSSGIFGCRDTLSEQGFLPGAILSCV